LSIAIPLYDEEGNVEHVARELLAVFRRGGVPLRLVLVDNGSRDGTRAQIEALEAKEPEVVGVYLGRNQGYGGGILAGIERCDSDLLGYMWGDGQVAAEDVLRVYRRLVHEGADLAKARRIARDDGPTRAIVTRIYNTANLWLFHIPSTDANGCPKLLRRSAWDRLAPRSKDWFLDPEIMLGAVESGMKIAEVDVRAGARHSGHSKVKGATVFEFAVHMLRRRLFGAGR
jgi:glycosyltransferase involved in cell wall biosynthesis